MKRARWVGFALTLLLAVPMSLNFYRSLRYCSNTPAGDAWRDAQQADTGVDPCEEARQENNGRIIPMTFAIALAFTITAVVAMERKRRGSRDPE